MSETKTQFPSIGVLVDDVQNDASSLSFSGLDLESGGRVTVSIRQDAEIAEALSPARGALILLLTLEPLDFTAAAKLF